MPGAADRDRICVGAIAGAQGVNGAVRIKPFTDAPEDVAAYGPVANEAGDRVFDLDIREVRGGLVIARLDGVEDRNAAEALKGLRLYVSRDALPAPDEDEFYHADLLGLRVVMAGGPEDGSKEEGPKEEGPKEDVGTVRAIIPAGATEVLEIDRGPGVHTLLVPFTKAAVPEVNVKAGWLSIDPPAETEATETDATETEEERPDEAEENGKTQE